MLPARGVYHVTARGVAHCAIFRDDIDRRLFLFRLRRIADEHAWRCSLYCLMTTHFHLLVDTSLDQLSSGMHRLQGHYAQRFNRKYVRVGHLFQERFHVKVVQDELYYETVQNYIRNNPVAAGLCVTPHEWPWTGSI